MLIRLTSLLFATSAAILLPASESSAQGRVGGSTGSGGGSSFGTSSFGQSSFGQSSAGSSSLGTSSFGQSSFGSGTAGGLGSSGTTGAATGATPFVGRGSADLDAFFGGLNDAFNNSQRSNRSGRSRSTGAGEAGRRPPVRVKLSVSPELEQAAASRRATGSMGRSISNAARLIAQRKLAGVSVASDGESVTLSGVVQSESERLLAEKLLAIEPGVRRIDNRLRLANEVQEVVPSPR